MYVTHSTFRESLPYAKNPLLRVLFRRLLSRLGCVRFRWRPKHAAQDVIWVGCWLLEFFLSIHCLTSIMKTRQAQAVEAPNLTDEMVAAGSDVLANWNHYSQDVETEADGVKRIWLAIWSRA